MVINALYLEQIYIYINLYLLKHPHYLLNSIYHLETSVYIVSQL